MQALHPIFPIFSDYFESFCFFKTRDGIVNLQISSEDISITVKIKQYLKKKIPGVLYVTPKEYKKPELIVENGLISQRFTDESMYVVYVVFDEEISKELYKYCNN